MFNATTKLAALTLTFGLLTGCGTNPVATLTTAPEAAKATYSLEMVSLPQAIKALQDKMAAEVKVMQATPLGAGKRRMQSQLAKEKSDLDAMRAALAKRQGK